MSNYDNLKSLITSFSGQQNIIGCPRIYCKFMGSLEGGVFLSQVVFYSDKGGKRDGWFYKTYSEWGEELELSRYKIKKYSKQLADMGILTTEVRKANGAPTVHYQFDCEKFTNRIVKFLQMESEESSKSITETTTETTKDIPSTLPGLEDVVKDEDAPDGRSWFLSLAEVCNIDLSLMTDKQRGQLAQSSKLLKETGISPEQISAFRVWWDENDWRGRRGQAPSPAQVREEWGRFAHSAEFGKASGEVLEAVPVTEF